MGHHVNVASSTSSADGLAESADTAMTKVRNTYVNMNTQCAGLTNYLKSCYRVVGCEKFVWWFVEFVRWVYCIVSYSLCA